MNRNHKIIALVCGFLTVLNIAACGQVKEEESVSTEAFESSINQQESSTQAVENSANQQESSAQAVESSANQQESSTQAVESSVNQQESSTQAVESSVNQQESSAQAVENADSEKTAEELLDLFIDGAISADDPTEQTSAFYISDLNRDSEEWDSFFIGEKVDLDNDGENELVINGPYGGMYLDARDNRVYQFAGGGGTALVLSYTYYNGAVWIMYSNRSSAGFEFYHMEKYEGADNLVAEINFGEEFDVNNPEAGLKYVWNDTEISCDEYTELCSKIFAAEVSTN